MSHDAMLLDMWYGWEPTPRKNKRKKVKKVKVEYRLKPSERNRYPGMQCWYPWRSYASYPNLQAAQQAISALQSSRPFWEFRIPPE